MAQIHYSWDEIDRICDYAIQTVREQNFSPDAIVGITTGGAILGRIIATKMKCPFYPDYRRYSNSVYLEVPQDVKKVLIVDDVMDYGGTIKCCTKDITKKLKGNVDIKHLAFCVTGAATFNPNFKLFAYANQLFPWHAYEDPIKNPQFKLDMDHNPYAWGKDIAEMVKQLAPHTHQGCDEYYKKCILDYPVLEKFRSNEGAVSLKLKLGKPLDFNDFIEKMKDENILLLDENTQTSFKLIDEKDKGNVFDISMSSDGLSLTLNFTLQSGRAFPQMCNNCIFKPKNSTEDYPTNICITCNKTSRSLVSFVSIHDYLIVKNELMEVSLLVNGVEELSDAAVRSKIALKKLKRCP